MEMFVSISFVFPMERGRFVAKTCLSAVWGSRSYRAHLPGMSDDEMEDLWDSGEDMARGCTAFFQRGVPDPAKNCIACDNLSACNGEREESRPDLFRMIKEAYAHDHDKTPF